MYTFLLYSSCTVFIDCTLNVHWRFISCQNQTAYCAFFARALLLLPPKNTNGMSTDARLYALQTNVLTKRPTLPKKKELTIFGIYLVVSSHVAVEPLFLSLSLSIKFSTVNQPFSSSFLSVGSLWMCRGKLCLVWPWGTNS